MSPPGKQARIWAVFPLNGAWGEGWWRMLRLTGGQFGGRLLKTPSLGGMRPTQDRVRAALFSSLGDMVPGCRFLDLFAGCGAVGLEAWSRGAIFVRLVESDGRTFNVLKENIAGLAGAADAAGRTPVDAVRADVFRHLAGRRETEPFDIVFADPPYDMAPSLVRKTLRMLAAGHILASGGMAVLEERGSGDAGCSGAEGFATVKVRDYGGSRLRYFALLREP